MAHLNPVELEIMKILWTSDWLKPGEIQEQLETPIKNSALRWYLLGLVEKGQIVRRKNGKAFYYRAKAPQQSVLRSLVRRMADVFSEGSAAALIGMMIESETNLSEEEIRTLQQIAERRVASKATGKEP